MIVGSEGGTFIWPKSLVFTIVLKPGLVWRVNPGPGRSEVETGSGLRKNRESQNPG